MSFDFVVLLVVYIVGWAIAFVVTPYRWIIDYEDMNEWAILLDASIWPVKAGKAVIEMLGDLYDKYNNDQGKGSA